MTRDQGHHDVPTTVGVVRRFRREIVLLAIFGTFIGLLQVTPPPDLGVAGWRSICLFALVVFLWVSNYIPLAVTSLLAIAGIPLLGIMPEADAYAFFGSKVVFFILGAFILGASLVGSGLSTRIAMVTVKRLGKSPRQLVGSIFLIGAIGSCFMSEHAVAAMLFPIAMSIARNLELAQTSPRLGRALFSALAWGCIVGGTTTILGGGRGPLAIGILEEFSDGQYTIGFVEYVLLDIPLVLILLAVGYLLLRRIAGVDKVDMAKALDRLQDKLESQGSISRREIGVGIVMTVTIVLWVVRGHEWGLGNIAIVATAVLFFFNLMTWRDVEEGVNWGVLLMYGGAISMGAALQQSGAASWLVGPLLESSHLDSVFVLLILGSISLVLTELMSNSAVIAVLLPVALEFGAARGIDLRVVTMSVVLPSNFAFVFPMATPANALAYSSGFMGIRQMIRTGLMMNMVGYIAFIFLLFVYWPMLGYNLGG
ncbi:MAG: DASS family sodium-coupled anion symporter [Myxococcales bacterium]|nr:DASS family sodium-coupled anion symporter [Myxococcales bacterium]